MKCKYHKTCKHYDKDVAMCRKDMGFYHYELGNMVMCKYYENEQAKST